MIRTTGAPPPGFEAFFQTQETVVDVYYAGRFLTGSRARFDPDTITFLDAEKIVAAIPDLANPAQLLELLGGGLPTNSARLCGRTQRDDCGRLEEDATGVIFDSSRFSANLFVARDDLLVRGPAIDRYLPASDAPFSALQNISAAWSGSDDGDDAFNIQSVTAFAWRETNLQLESAWNDNDDVTIDAVSVRREYRGRETQVGLYRSRGQSLGFVSDRDIVGVRFGSSLRTRSDRAFSGGTPIAVFLPSRARVEIVQDGRLLSTQAYEAGNQVLDTSGLPEGAYEIELRIQELGGRTRIERRFFVKTTRIPPMDQPLWSVEFGRVVDRNTNGVLPEDTGEEFARLSYAQRLGPSLGYDVAAIASGSEMIGQAGLYRIAASTETQISGFVGRRGDHGLAGFARLRTGAVTGSLDFRFVRAREQDTVGQVPLLNGDLDQIGLTLSSPLRGGRLNFVARYDVRGDFESDSQSLSWDRFVALGGRDGLRVLLEVSRQDDDWVGLGSVEYSLRRGNWFARVEPGGRFDRRNADQDDAGSQTRARLAWENQLARGRRARIGVNGVGGVAEQRIGADALYESRLGVLGAQIDRDFDQTDRTFWTGRLNTSLLTDGRSLSVGGQDSARSAAMIAIPGSAPGARFEVLVDDFVRGIADAGTVTPIHLQPWRSYRIRLRPVGEALIAWENREEQITLYPGNVVRLEWPVSEVAVLLGRIVDADGDAVEGARLDGAYGLAVSEMGGLFQAEVTRDDGRQTITLTAVRRNSEPCTVNIDLEGRTARRGIYRVGTQRCE